MRIGIWAMCLFHLNISFVRFQVMNQVKEKLKLTMNGRMKTLDKDMTVSMLISSKACLGDSGSPAVLKRDGKLYAYGIYSLSTGMCGGEDEASFYVDTSKYLQWIMTWVDHH